MHQDITFIFIADFLNRCFMIISFPNICKKYKQGKHDLNSTFFLFCYKHLIMFPIWTVSLSVNNFCCGRCVGDTSIGYLEMVYSSFKREPLSGAAQDLHTGAEITTDIWGKPCLIGWMIHGFSDPIDNLIQLMISTINSLPYKTLFLQKTTKYHPLVVSLQGSKTANGFWSVSHVCKYDPVNNTLHVESDRTS